MRAWLASMPSMQAPRKPAPADAADAAHAASLSPISRATAAVPSGELSSTKMTSQSTPLERARELLDQQRNIVALLEGRDDDAQFRRGPRRGDGTQARALGKRRSLRVVIGEGGAHFNADGRFREAMR